MLKSLIGNALRQRGYHVFHEKHLAQANLSLHLRTLFTTQQVDCVFDVGANVGQYYEFLREAVGYRGLVVSFEPVPKMLKVLQRQAQTDSSWIVSGCALGAAPGTLPINVMKGDSLSSFRAPSIAGTDRFRESNTVVSVEQVSVRTLDAVYQELVTQHGFRRPYLKMDTQGFDLEVAKGGTTHLSDFIGLQTEASLLSLYEEQPNFLDTLGFFKAKGFTESAFYPISMDQKLRMIECDCVFVNPARMHDVAVAKY